MNFTAQPKRFLRRGGQIPRQTEPKGLDAETHYSAGLSTTKGLAAAWAEDLLGSAEKKHQPEGGAPSQI